MVKCLFWYIVYSLVEIFKCWINIIFYNFLILLVIISKRDNIKNEIGLGLVLNKRIVVF